MTEKAKPWRCGYCLRTARHCRRRGSSPVCDGCRAHLTALGKKFCGHCGQAKPLAQFRRTGSGGERRARCNACYRAAFHERDAAYMRTYWQTHREQRKAYMRQYKAKNPEQTRRYNRSTYISWKIRQSERLRAARSKQEANGGS